MDCQAVQVPFRPHSVEEHAPDHAAPADESYLQHTETPQGTALRAAQLRPNAATYLLAGGFLRPGIAPRADLEVLANPAEPVGAFRCAVNAADSARHSPDWLGPEHEVLCAVNQLRVNYGNLGPARFARLGHWSVQRRLFPL